MLGGDAFDKIRAVERGSVGFNLISESVIPDVYGLGYHFLDYSFNFSGIFCQ